MQDAVPRRAKRARRISDLRLALVLRLRAWPVFQAHRETLFEDFLEVHHWRLFLGPLGIIVELELRP